MNYEFFGSWNFINLRCVQLISIKKQRNYSLLYCIYFVEFIF